MTSKFVYSDASYANVFVGCTTPEDVQVTNAKEKADLAIPKGITIDTPSFIRFGTPIVPKNGLVLNPLSPQYLVASPLAATVNTTTHQLLPSPAANVFSYLSYEGLLTDDVYYIVPRLVPVELFDLNNLLLSTNAALQSGFSFSNITFDIQVLPPNKSSDLNTAITVNKYTANTTTSAVGYYYLTSTAVPPAAGTVGVPIYASGNIPAVPAATYATITVTPRPNATARFELTFSPSTDALQGNYLWVFFSPLTFSVLSA
ncbi:hypothetical protein EBZ80_17780 [bacterium]|nr:hypothetical protein [bacterium]